MNGIIVGSDQTLEWALPWWWERYRQWNTFPVAFIDLGLSYEKKKWCRERGKLIPLRVVDFAENPAPDMKKQWECEAGLQFVEARNAWFKKPLACLQSPFAKTLWIDVDCEVKAPLTPLFEYASHFAMALEQNPYLAQYPLYNSGVIAFRNNHPLLQCWAEWCYLKNKTFRGDQEVFSHMIGERNIRIDELPPIYNWSRRSEERSDAAILHWHGYHGKFIIRTQRVFTK